MQAQRLAFGRPDDASLAHVAVTLLGLAAWLPCVACHDPAAQTRLQTGDQVVLERALKGHELVVTKGNDQARIRLVGIYTFDPAARDKAEVTTPGKAAVEQIERAARGKTLRLELIRPEPDPRGRFLAYAAVDGIDLGNSLLEAGNAAVYTEYPFAREAAYLVVEQPARDDSRGLWNKANARKRVQALRTTWAAVRRRALAPVSGDPLLKTP